MRTDDFWDALVYGVSWSRLTMEDVMPGETKKRAIRVGDEYDVPVEVTGVDLKGPKQYRVAVRGRPYLADWVCGETLEASRLVEAAPEPLKVGDSVLLLDTKPPVRNPSGYPLIVLAIDGNVAWVGNSPEGVHWTVKLEDLRRVV